LAAAVNGSSKNNDYKKRSFHSFSDPVLYFRRFVSVKTRENAHYLIGIMYHFLSTVNEDQ